MRTAMLFAVLSIIPCGCGALNSEEPDPRVVGERYMNQIVGQSGNLEGMEFVNLPAVICEYSMTHLPTINWENVVATKWKETVLRGPGPSQELKNHGVEFDSAKPLIDIVLEFDVKLKDGTSRTATLSLRPADDGTLKIVPPSGQVT